MIVKKSCSDVVRCHAELKSQYPDLTGIDHIENNHVIHLANEVIEDKPDTNKSKWKFWER